jgi:hypothetical protein
LVIVGIYKSDALVVAADIIAGNYVVDGIANANTAIVVNDCIV